MVQRLMTWLSGPLRIGVQFEERSYKLGDAVGLTVELNARRDIQVMEGRVDLVIEKKYAEQFTRMVASRDAGILTRGPKTHMLPRVEIKEHKEHYIHSSVVFMKNARLRSARVEVYNPRLKIGPEPHPEAQTGVLSWFLVATVRVDGGEDIKRVRGVTVEHR